MTTESKGLLDWVIDPTPDRGVHILDGQGRWTYCSYEQLASAISSLSWAFSEHGVTPGDVVSLAMPTGREFIASFFASLACGATPSPIAPPMTFQPSVTYDSHLSHVVRTAQPRLVVTTRDRESHVAPVVAKQVPAPVLSVSADDMSTGGSNWKPRQPDTALLQFTSGSTGRPKGVVVPRSALESNINAIRQWLQMTPQDPTASWLPLHHDMGLIGCLLTPIVNQSELWIMSPEDFVRSPIRWLECFGRFGARLSASPNFGLGYVARRVKPEQLEGMDFSEWRALISGAERVDPDVLGAFSSLLKGHGFDPLAFLPAYGLAEATLAVTGLRLEEPVYRISVDRRTLEPGKRVQLVEASCEDEWWSLSLVGCGEALGDTAVRILSVEGRPLEDGHLGEIAIRGSSIAARYAGSDQWASSVVVQGGESEAAIQAAGYLATGDAGFTLDGQLFVLGRLGDSIKRRARTVFAEDLEEGLRSIEGLARARPVVMLGTHEGTDKAVVLVEIANGEWSSGVEAFIKRHAEDIEVVVICVRSGTVLRTSSGKPRRKEMWQLFQSTGFVHRTRASAN